VGLADHAGGAGSDGGQHQVDVVVVAEHHQLHAGVGLQQPRDQVGRAVQAEGGVDQHQVGEQAADRREGLLGRGAAADDHVGPVAGEQRLQRLVEQRLRIGQQHSCHRYRQPPGRASGR